MEEEITHQDLLDLIEHIVENQKMQTENMQNLVTWAGFVNDINQNLITSIQNLRGQIKNSNHTHWWQR